MNSWPVSFSRMTFDQALSLVQAIRHRRLNPEEFISDKSKKKKKAAQTRAINFNKKEKK